MVARILLGDSVMSATPYFDSETSLPNTAGRCTIYFRHDMGMGVTKVECRSAEWGEVSYAQYDNAVAVRFVPKGKQRTRGIVETFQPECIILDGWGHPDPDPKEDESTRREGNGVSSVRCKYSSSDPRWMSALRTKLAGRAVLRDFQGHEVKARF
jgi:hypothetical protein